MERRADTEFNSSGDLSPLVNPDQRRFCNKSCLIDLIIRSSLMNEKQTDIAGSFLALLRPIRRELECIAPANLERA